MHRDDLVRHTLRWTWGACVMWNYGAEQFNSIDEKFRDFVQRTHTVVWNYLVNKNGLDGSCSDFECSTALHAEELFGRFFTV